MSFPLPQQNVPFVSTQTGNLSQAAFQYLARLLRDISDTLERLEQNDEVIRNILRGLGALEEDLDDIISGQKSFEFTTLTPPPSGLMPPPEPDTLPALLAPVAQDHVLPSVHVGSVESSQLPPLPCP